MFAKEQMTRKKSSFPHLINKCREIKYLHVNHLDSVTCADFWKLALCFQIVESEWGKGGGGGRLQNKRHKPKLAVWKFSSCDGCQLSLLDCEDELLAVADAVEIANFPEASRAVVKGPYDLSLVEGSITTPHDAERIHGIRRASKFLVTIGACATAGGIQALRNFKDVQEFISIVYARPDYIETLKKSTPITDHVFVDFELRGCPINKYQLVEVSERISQRPQAQYAAP